MKLMHSIYSMKQAGRIWNQMFDSTVTIWGFLCLSCKWCMYRHDIAMGTMIFAVHVDNIFSIANPPEEHDRFKAELHSKWDISKLGPVKFALGISIEQSKEKQTISLSQTAFIDQLIECFNLPDAYPVDMPMVQGLQICCPDKTMPIAPKVVKWMEDTPYCELVRSLNYIMVATQPDISFAVGCLASVLDCYRPKHWSAALQVLCYLKGTCHLHLVLGGLPTITLSGFSDSDYANCLELSHSMLQSWTYKIFISLTAATIIALHYAYPRTTNAQTPTTSATSSAVPLPTVPDTIQLGHSDLCTSSA